jgi:hypothetical protein
VFRLVRIGNAREKCHPGMWASASPAYAKNQQTWLTGGINDEHFSHKDKWSAASFALVLASALLPGSTSRATGAEAGAQEKPVRVEKLAIASS